MTYQGLEVEKLSIEQRRWSISAISRDDLTGKILNNNRVSDQHFHTGTAAPLWDRHNIDWVPNLNLGHGKSVTRREQNEVKKLERRGRRKGKNNGQNCKNKNVY